MAMSFHEVMAWMEGRRNEKNRAGMARFGINTERAYGISVVDLRKLAKSIPKDHSLAIELWNSGMHEAMILSSMVDEPEKVTEAQMEHQVVSFGSWDLCDQVCMNLFCETPFARKKAQEWSKRREEFVKRAAFALMACLAQKDSGVMDLGFVNFFDAIKRESGDERNYVKKAINWALRQIGKRNAKLNRMAIKTAKSIAKMSSKSSKWIARDALRELESPEVKKRVEEIG
jgi:3-methyladenine DNA glycosylase AlkD